MTIQFQLTKSSNSKQLGHNTLRYRTLSLLLSTILGFYMIGRWLIRSGELIVESTASIVESYDCFQPLHRPIFGQYKHWHIGSNSSAPKVLNVGFPKTGTSTLYGFLSKNTMGYNVSHWQLRGRVYNTALIGSCMASAIKNNLPPLSTCGNYAAYTQMDCIDNIKGCHFPQISYLKEIYEEEPSAVFILPFRNMTSWIRSINKWSNLRSRFTNLCTFPEYNFTIGIGRKDEEMEDLFCQHVKHVRNFVLEHPTLTLIEYLISEEGVGDYLASLLPHMKLNGSHYGHENVNNNTIKQNL